ncbi:MAG: DNA internalization-related competence protein ComEC/Rec2 [Mariprofundales bacterium]|nr:DNA internalization-related competence protein ComEC/Rec2 [Mariprofundales bacterium]
MGIALGMAEAVAWWLTLLIALLALLLWWRGRQLDRGSVWTKGETSGWQAGALALALGIGWGMVVLTHSVWLQQVDAGWLRPSVRIDAEVVAVQRSAHRQRLTLKAVRRSDGGVLRGEVWLYLYGRKGRSGWLVGDHIHTAIHGHRPRNHANPGGFDFVSYCAAHGVALLASVASGSSVQRSASPTMLARLRQRVRAALVQVGIKPRAVLSALVLADRSQLSDAQWQHFSASGTAHLLAISGLHIGIVAGWGFFFTWWLLTRREAWVVRWPVRSYALFSGLVFAIAYATLAGWTLPTQRAVLMLAAGVAAWWWRAQASSLNTMLAALMVMLLWDAQSVASLSLWLSFVAVTGLLLFADRLGNRTLDWKGRIAAMAGVTVIAALVTLPLIATVFGRLPLYTLPANLLLVPLYAMWILPCSLVAALLAMLGWGAAAAGLFSLAGVGAELGGALLAWLYRLPGGSWWLPHLPWWGVTMLVVSLLAAAGLAWNRHFRWAGGVIALALVGLMLWPERGVVVPVLTVWDVGQGAATTLRLPGGFVMAVDAPGSAGSRFNGGSMVADGLRIQGVTHLDVVAVSHLQSDHAGGIGTLMRRMNGVGELWLSDVPENRSSHWAQGLIALAQTHGGRVRWLARGDRVVVAGHAVRVLWPPRGAVAANSNNLSLVLSVDLGAGRRLLMMGDSELPVERGLLASIRPHTMMLMPHHGSRSSSSAALLRQLHPALAIAQTGYHNRYGFPDPKVVARYRALGAAVMNTASGAVEVTLNHASLRRTQWSNPVAHKREVLAMIIGEFGGD